MTAINHADGVSYGSQAASRVYAGSVLVWERFKPTDITGCKVWLDAASLGLANGAAVPAFTNLAGSPQPTVLGTPAPVFRTNMLNTSMPCVRITQGQGRYRFTGTGVDRDWTLIYVTRNWLLRGGRVVTALGTSANILVGYHATEMDVCYVEGWMTSSAMPRTTTQWRLYSADFGIDGERAVLLGRHPDRDHSRNTSKGLGRYAEHQRLHQRRRCRDLATGRLRYRGSGALQQEAVRR